MKSFDKTYNDHGDFFGHPYKELKDYFQNLPKGKVLDIGCGQGRDAIFLSSIGFDVTAVDTSKIGISQMISRDKKIRGIVADVLALDLVETFDIILFDMILHSFEKNKQTELLKKYSKNLHKDGLMCIVYPVEDTTDHFSKDMNANYFLDILNSFNNWELIDKIAVHDVPKPPGDNGDYTFEMILVKFE